MRNGLWHVAGNVSVLVFNNAYHSLKYYKGMINNNKGLVFLFEKRTLPIVIGSHLPSTIGGISR